MVRIEFIPGNIVSPNAITLPTTAPDIETVISAVIARVPDAVAAHGGSGTDVVHADGATPPPHVNAAVAAHAVTQPDAHTLTPDVAKGAGVSLDLGVDGAGNLETEGVAKIAMTTCIDVHTGGAVDTHVGLMTDPDDHAQAAIVAALADHGQAAIAAALADHVGADPVVGGGPYDVTRLTTRTFSLNVDTEEGDLLTIVYLEVGERVLVS